MYTSQKNVQILIALLKQYNVHYAVISPGSRNMPLVHSIENDPFFTCYSVVDERSAAYFAIGLSVDKDSPVFISCTSSQATRNYLPGMTEAYYRGIPLVVITADYKPSLIGQGTMQAIDQMSIPKDTAKISVHLPVVKDRDDQKYCARLVNEALLELNHHGKGPIHIDVPTEDLWSGSVTVLPNVKKIDRYTLKDRFPELDGKRILISIGSHSPFSKKQKLALDNFSENYNAVVYTNHLSNYHGPRSVLGNLLLSSMDEKAFESYKPDLLISIGGQTGDYALAGRLKRVNFEHWRVNEDGLIVDTYEHLTKVFECSEWEFFSVYNKMPSGLINSTYFEMWSSSAEKKVLPDNLPLSHAFVASKLSKKIPSDSIIHFAILSSLRNWSFFDIDSSIVCYSNVAAFGIDGCLSTFIGQSVASDKKCFLVIGDLSFFYDMNAIGIRHIKNNARVVLVNNNGGGEFRLYSHAANEFGDESNRHIAAAGHNGAAQSWVESMGWNYISVKSKEDLTNNIDRFVGNSDKPVFMEVFTTMTNDSDGVKLMIDANSHNSIQGKIVNMMSSKMKRTVKKILKK